MVRLDPFDRGQPDQQTKGPLTQISAWAALQRIRT